MDVGIRQLGCLQKSVKWRWKKVKIFFRAIVGDFDAVFACFGVVFSIFCECLFF